MAREGRREDPRAVKINPSITFILLDTAVRPAESLKTLECIQEQVYPHWDVRACLAPGEKDREETLGFHLKRPEAFEIVKLGVGTGVLEPLLVSLRQKCGDYFLFLDPGDTFSADFLRSLVAQIEAQNGPDILYFDVDVRLDDRGQLTPKFRPDWSPELLISNNYLSHALFHRNLLKEAESVFLDGNLKAPCDIIFAAARGARQVGHLAWPLLREAVSGPDPAALRQCVQTYLSCLGLKGVSLDLTQQGHTHARWDIDAKLVSIIIPTRENLLYLKRCLSSLFDRTAYPNYEIILVDHASRGQDVLDYYDVLQNTGRAVKIVPGGESFNFNRFNNLGAQSAAGEYLLFLNNDVEIVDSDWLAELVQWASLPEIGAVGAKLLYPDKTVQHAGIILGLQGHASHIFQGAPADYQGCFGSVNWYRDYLAVTAACMMSRREVFDRLGGFDEKYRLVFSDVEYCLRVIAAGYRVMYNPFAVLIHHEGKSRGKFIPAEDIRLAYHDFKEWVEAGDPYFNRNLSTLSNVPALRFPGEQPPIKRLEKIVRYMA